MKRNTVRLIITLGTMSIVGIILTQAFWVRKAFDLKEKEFNKEVSYALKHVAQDILKYNQNTSPLIDPVHQITSNYFTVAVNDKIDPKLLEGLLKNEFVKRGIKTRIDFSIYNCMGKKIEYQSFISFDSTPVSVTAIPPLPSWNYENYYFSIYLPDKNTLVFKQMEVWSVSTVLILCIVIFFAYSLFIILKQKRLSEVQKDFINNMTHEFKTPITTISISSEVLKDPSIIDNPSRLFNYATIIQDEALRLKNQVERILQMATLDKEKIALNKEEVNMHEVLKCAADHILISDINKPDIHFSLHAKSPVIKGDKLHLINIIYNLIDNAVKYSKGQAEIDIRTESIKNGINIFIRDKGIGINNSDKKKVFDKFYRVPVGNVHDVKGFGLGLNYVKNLIEAHKGYIQLESEINKGSTFTIYLPFS
jgi:two-component system phosphate regulon sensor histidine kinase PhoR